MAAKKRTAATPGKSDAKEQGEPEDVLLVTSAKPRRRAGFRLGPTQTVIRKHETDEAMLKAFDEDPLISIRQGTRVFNDAD